ncbi:hypothetical protein SADO_00600 [Salinisphaera dokdonensis CL-ES53]|uniref:Uncharacterized protein n=1 Tax=Salinisphaera dokdonensis CL-ES53 TaxID=1304272 RepID=A0ABV2AVR5_9GAMM
MSVHHFLLTQDGAIEEFSEAEASEVAEGKRDLPQHAEQRLRYVQVAYEDQANDDGEIHVKTLGAIVSFDNAGRIQEAGTAENEQDKLDAFEHDACVQYALRDAIGRRYALN